MPTSFNLILLVLISAVLISSCTVVDRYAFSPATANLLQAEHKNDVKISGNYSSAGKFTALKGEHRKSNGFDGQGLYAVSNKVALGAAAYKKWEENKSTYQNIPSGYRYQKSGTEFSAGVYNFSKTEERSSFQLFGGVGFGKGSIKGFYTDSTGYMEFHNSRYNKYFLQPTFSLKAGERSFIVLATRLNIIHFHTIESNLLDPERDGLNFLGQKNSMFQDFILNETFYLKNPAGLGFQLQQGITGLYTHFNDDAILRTNYQYNNLWFSAGIVWDINKAFK